MLGIPALGITHLLLVRVGIGKTSTLPSLTRYGITPACFSILLTFRLMRLRSFVARY